MDVASLTSQQDPQYQHSSWATELVGSFFRELAKTAAPTDVSLPELQELARRGYQWVEWESPNGKCFTCQDLHGQVWPLEEFLNFTKHEAPLFSKSHVGCRCFVKVTGTDKNTGTVLPEQIVVAF